MYSHGIDVIKLEVDSKIDRKWLIICSSIAFVRIFTLMRLMKIVIPAAARKAFITGSETNLNRKPAIEENQQVICRNDVTGSQ
jgi:hypothetical protein